MRPLKKVQRDVQKALGKIAEELEGDPIPGT